MQRRPPSPNARREPVKSLNYLCSRCESWNPTQQSQNFLHFSGNTKHSRFLAIQKDSSLENIHRHHRNLLSKIWLGCHLMLIGRCHMGNIGCMCLHSHELKTFFLYFLVIFHFLRMYRPLDIENKSQFWFPLFHQSKSALASHFFRCFFSKDG